MQEGNALRLSKLDTLRGLTLISMILYHAMWDLVYIFNINNPWYKETPGYIWQQSICWTFILLSGFSWPLGRHPVKRGILVSLCGILVTAVTFFALPEEPVIFGILTFMGAAMLLTAAVDRIPVNRKVLFSVALILFILTKSIHLRFSGTGLFTAFMGFPYPGFVSSDYFPLIPWYFLYLCGYSLNGILLKGEGGTEKVKELLTPGIFPPLELIGRNTLILYMLHQPVIMAVLTFFFRAGHGKNAI